MSGRVVLNDPRGNYRVNSERHGRLSNEQAKRLRELVTTDLPRLSVNTIAQIVGCSSRTVVRERAKNGQA